MKLIITVALLSGLASASRHEVRNRAEELLYYRGQCQNTIAAVGSILVASAYDEAKTATACTQLRGNVSNFGCMIAGDKNTPDLTRASWKEACATAGADTDDLFGRDYLTEEEIEDYAGCQRTMSRRNAMASGLALFAASLALARRVQCANTEKMAGSTLYK
jgi:hypothetical protein